MEKLESPEERQEYFYQGDNHGSGKRQPVGSKKVKEGTRIPQKPYRKDPKDLDIYEA